MKENIGKLMAYMNARVAAFIYNLRVVARGPRGWVTFKRLGLREVSAPYFRHDPCLMGEINSRLTRHPLLNVEEEYDHAVWGELKRASLRALFQGILMLHRHPKDKSINQQYIDAARSIRNKNPGMTEAKALAKAVTDNPELYAAYQHQKKISNYGWMAWM